MGIMVEYYILSIIIPVYNVEKYIKECLDSVFQQNLENIEVIIVDDRGEDGSIELVNCYQKEHENCRHMRIIKHTENKGLSEARNTGIRNAKGKYITFLDSDDLIEPNSLSYVVKWLYENEVDIVELNYKEINNTGLDIQLENKKQNHYFNIMSGEKYFISINQKNMYVPIVCSKIYRKSYLLDHKLFVPTLYFEDEEFMPRTFLFADRVCSINFDFYIYRRRIDSISTSYEKNRKWVPCYLYIIKSLLSLSKKITNQDCKWILKNRAGQLVLSLIKNQCKYSKSKSQWKYIKQLMKKKKLYLIPMESHVYKTKIQGFLCKNPMLFRILYFMYLKIREYDKRKEKKV